MTDAFPQKGHSAERAMDMAFEEAAAAARRGEVPVGAVLLSPNGDVLARAGNEVLLRIDPSAHAELLVIRQACALLQSERLPGTDLYVTLEPCTMCAAAISFARIRRLYFAAYDQKAGGVEHGACFFHQRTCHHAPEVYGGIQEERAREQLKSFFQDRRIP